jgi:hypothetical protein
MNPLVKAVAYRGILFGEGCSRNSVEDGKLGAIAP